MYAYWSQRHQTKKQVFIITVMTIPVTIVDFPIFI